MFHARKQEKKYIYIYIKLFLSFCAWNIIPPLLGRHRPLVFSLTMVPSPLGRNRPRIVRPYFDGSLPAGARSSVNRPPKTKHPARAA